MSLAYLSLLLLPALLASQSLLLCLSFLHVVGMSAMHDLPWERFRKDKGERRTRRRRGINAFEGEGDSSLPPFLTANSIPLRSGIINPAPLPLFTASAELPSVKRVGAMLAGSFTTMLTS